MIWAAIIFAVIFFFMSYFANVAMKMEDGSKSIPFFFSAVGLIYMVAAIVTATWAAFGFMSA